MINISRTPANLNSIGEVCKGLGEHTASSFACNLWATADSDELISGEGRVLEAILCSSGTSPSGSSRLLCPFERYILTGEGEGEEHPVTMGYILS